MGAVLEQEDPVRAAVGGDPLGVEGDVAADVDEDRRLRLVPLGLALEVLEGHAEVRAVAVDELDLGAGGDRRERRRHEGVGRAEHGLAAHPGELERGQRAAGPAREAEARQPVPLCPALLERLQLAALGPLLGVEHLGPELEEPAAVAMVEPDRELAASDRVVSADPKSAARLAAGRRHATRAVNAAGLVGRLDHGADRPRAGQQDGAADGEAIEATSAAPPSGVVAPRLAEDQRRQHDRDEDLDREHRPAPRGSPGAAAARSSR